VTARLVVLSGPSGVGKGSVIAAVRRRHPQVWVSVSVTTRPPRPGETEGVEYHFVDQTEFTRLVAAGEMLEHDAHLSASYGTPRAPVEARLAEGLSCLLEIDVQGARQVKAALSGALLVFLAPPSVAELERRLVGRGTEDPARVKERLELARYELTTEGEFDTVIVNDDLWRAADALVALLDLG